MCWNCMLESLIDLLSCVQSSRDTIWSPVSALNFEDLTRGWLYPSVSHEVQRRSEWDPADSFRCEGIRIMSSKQHSCWMSLPMIVQWKGSPFRRTIITRLFERGTEIDLVWSSHDHYISRRNEETWSQTARIEMELRDLSLQRPNSSHLFVLALKMQMMIPR